MSLIITPHSSILSTAPQAAPEDMVQVKQAGFAAVVNNRPDFEHDEPSQPTAQAVAAAAQDLGLVFFDLPFSPAQIDANLARQFAQVLSQLPQPVLVYCRSGARSTRIYQMAVELGYLDPENLAFLV